MPKAGFTAGPCLLKDTLALVSFSGNEFPLGQAAVSVNEGLPLFLVNKIKSQYDISIMTVGILGMTFKANIDDIRSSLAFKLRKTLLFHSKKVMWHDPYWEDSGSSSLNSILKESDILIIATPHKEYEILETPKPIIDIWSFTNKNE
jgi:UDP-N-acetyl-D-mannosaminuronic acid dehydrogenase